MSAPNPINPYPPPDYPRHCVFLKPTITSEKVVVVQIAAIAATVRRGGGTPP